MPKKILQKFFHSKVLLLGEHIINKGATGLAIPFEHYYGVLKFGNLGENKIAASNQSLTKLAHYIIYHEQLSKLYNTNQILEDLERGLYFDSDVPQGYGLGSSGALIAAIYTAYRKPRKKTEELSEVKHELALLESFYHGKSSGLDPIVCFLNKAVLIKNGEVTKVFEMPIKKEGALKIFLINTHIERQTSPYVNLFLKKCEDKQFFDTVTKSLIPANEIAVESLLKCKYTSLMNSVKIISQLQLNILPEFIPDKYKKVWKDGLSGNEFHLKICGAGGGGFIIGFAKAGVDLGLLLGALDVIEIGGV
jgi:mevalonate kinase